MKHKIIKILAHPKSVIGVTALVALCAAFFIYKFVGVAPHVALRVGAEKTASIAGNYRNGDEVNLAFPKGGRVASVAVKVGDDVHKGDVLASLDSVDADGMVNQAKGALLAAQANYEKILNGATSPDIDVLKAAVQKAEDNLAKTKQTQNTAVSSAYFNLLNSSIVAVPADGTSDFVAPIISGSYNLGKVGDINLSFYYSTGGITFVTSGLVTSKGQINLINEQPIGDSGLYIKFPANQQIVFEDWKITIPNKKAPNYLANYNAYQTALSVADQSITAATNDLDQARSVLAARQAAARPEDVAIAKASVEAATGALKIAEGAYANNFIYAPEDGVVTVVNIKSGEIAAMNQRIISMVVKK